MARQNTIEIIIRGKDEASKPLGGVLKSVSSLGKGLLIAGGAVAAVGVGVGAAITKLAIDAAPLQGIEEAFEGIAKASGKSADEMLAALKKGSAGMISQRDLMKSYNLAAQLVGDQFANQLPQAMGYLGKVAAATGEDMGYMMDSLVRGVGRLSPMILDNLGIQVDLAAANEAYAKTIGKTVGELTKQEQQTALMAQVMEKLAQNTANMPEVAGSAAAQLAGLGAKIQDLKDAVGTAFLPVLSRLLGMFNDLVDKYGPRLAEWAEKAGGWLAGMIDEFSQAVEGGWPSIMAKLEEWGKRFWDWLTGPGGAAENAGASLQKVLDAVGGWLAANWPVISGYLGDWAARFWEWLETDVVPVAKVKLEAVSEAIRKWAESPDTQAKLAQIGETTGRGLVEGVRALVTVAKTWTPIMVGLADALSQAMTEAALPAMKAIGSNLSKGIVTGLTEALGLDIPEALKFIPATLGMAPFPGLAQSALPGFQAGGVVPGPIGRPMAAMVHGGETVVPAGRGGEGQDVLYRILAVLERIATLSEQNGVVVIEAGAGQGGRAREAVLGLGDQSWALLPG